MLDKNTNKETQERKSKKKKKITIDRMTDHEQRRNDSIDKATAQLRVGSLGRKE